MKKNTRNAVSLGAAAIALAFAPSAKVNASSHMDAPLITKDPAANTTDVYAFVGDDGVGGKRLVTALGVYPHEEPGVGPNAYNFDDEVLYAIHVSTGSDVAAGIATYTYEFRFDTTFRTAETILQSYLGVVQGTAGPNQNLVQTYEVTKVTNASGDREELGSGFVPPNNQGIATPFYNQGDDGNNPAKGGVDDPANLDVYTAGSIATLANGYLSFAGQRDDGFYGDINSIFDLLSLRSGAGNGVDSQAGFNIHMMALTIPLDELGGDQQQVGVWATTSREQIDIVTNSQVIVNRSTNRRKNKRRVRRTTVVTNLVRVTQTPVKRFAQVARQGNPLFNEALVALADKDTYNTTTPASDAELFDKYARNPELAVLINALVPGVDAVSTGRDDLVGIYIPDVIKVDLSTPPVRLAGPPDDMGYSRLSVFGGDTLPSALTGGQVAGGWPNGRRFGDDVIDIAIQAIVEDENADGIDGVSANDISYNKVFPYEGTPQNGRVHTHDPIPMMMAP